MWPKLDMGKLARLHLPAALLAAALLPGQGYSQIAGGCRCGAISGFHSETRRHVTAETAEAAERIRRCVAPPVQAEQQLS